MKTKISVVINTLNEAKNIAGCIQSVESLADEIVVCDMHSQDGTAALAQGMGARVVLIEPMEGKYQRMRYQAVQAAAFDWVLQIDADERMTPALGEQLRRIAKEDLVDAVYVGILLWFIGGWIRHGGFYSVRYPRFFRRRVFLEAYREDTLQVHNDWAALREVKNVVYLPEDVYLLHLAYPAIEKYVSKTIGFYARVEAEQAYRLGSRFSFWRLLWDPFKSFVGRFIWRAGFLDGMRGFILAVLHAGYRFTIWANLWQLQEIERKREVSIPTESILQEQPDPSAAQPESFHQDG